jgi:hypothetical protein
MRLGVESRPRSPQSKTQVQLQLTWPYIAMPYMAQAPRHPLFHPAARHALLITDHLQPTQRTCSAQAALLCGALHYAVHS